jgi:hypothetical protein
MLGLLCTEFLLLQIAVNGKTDSKHFLVYTDFFNHTRPPVPSNNQLTVALIVI